MAARKTLLSVDYEVFGRVQGVFFRKYTRTKALELKLVGWVKNTKQNTVTGQVQGAPINVEKMKEWLSKTGSPSSIIEKCIFSNEKSVTTKSYKTFDIRK